MFEIDLSSYSSSADCIRQRFRRLIILAIFTNADIGHITTSLWQVYKPSNSIINFPTVRRSCKLVQEKKSATRRTKRLWNSTRYAIHHRDEVAVAEGWELKSELDEVTVELTEVGSRKVLDNGPCGRLCDGGFGWPLYEPLGSPNEGNSGWLRNPLTDGYPGVR